MEYNTTGSSNTATIGCPLELEIKISRNLQPNSILLTDVLTVENLDKIATDDELKDLSCALYGKTIDRVPEANNAASIELKKTNAVLICESPYTKITKTKRLFKLGDDWNTQYDYLILKIKSTTWTIKEPIPNLTILFKDKNIIDEKQQPSLNILQFAVHTEKDKPEIKFTADRTVLQGSKNSVKLEWEIKIIGEEYTYELKEGLTVLRKGEGKDTTNDNETIKAVAIGDHCYQLEVVKQGNAAITRNVVVRVLDRSTFYDEGNPQDNVIGNFCVSKNSDYLFSLILKENAEKTAAVLDYIGYTNEGFSGQWARFELTAGEKEELRPFATSPMIHLKDRGERSGRLLFIGGSYVKPMEDSNKIAIVDLNMDLGLDKNTSLNTIHESRVRVEEDIPWSSRMGHRCLIFPDESGEEKIWLLGGVDGSGEAKNDVWISGDGKTWNIINDDQSIHINTEDEKHWAQRCMVGAAVQLDRNGNKKAIWIAGGFSEADGRETPSIWKWEKVRDRTPTLGTGGVTADYNWKWEKVFSEPKKPLQVNEGSYLSSGLAFVGIDTSQSTGMHVLGGYMDGSTQREYFSKIENDGNNLFRFSDLNKSDSAGCFSTTANPYVLTGYFKGCLWFMVFTNQAYFGINYSKLFYWIPPVTSQTLLLLKYL